jgi:hypothetical protein
MAQSQCRWDSPEELSQWNDWLAAGLHGRNRWRLSVVVLGMLFAGGRRTVTTWLRAAGVSDDFRDYYYFLAAVGRKTEFVAERLFALLLVVLPLPERLLLAIDDSPTKRYGPKVEGAGVHHNPTPGPADQPFLYGHVWVTISLALRHPLFGPVALPLWAMLYVRQQTIAKIPRRRRWPPFATKLQLAARLVEWIMPIVKKAGKSAWIVVDGGYVKRPFLRRVLKTGATVVGRLRKDAALRDLPSPIKPGQRKRGRPRKYGRNKISLARRAAQTRGWQTVECMLYGQRSVKHYKTFLATYAPVGGLIRVVLVKEDHGWFAFFCTDPDATVVEILEAFADRASIEQDFHDVKEVWGAGQQQVRNIWTNVAAFNLNLWMHTLVELWAWRRPHDQLVDRSDSPWDQTDRRPSHADRRKALRRLIFNQQFNALSSHAPLPPKIAALATTLITMAA